MHASLLVGPIYYHTFTSMHGLMTLWSIWESGSILAVAIVFIMKYLFKRCDFKEFADLYMIIIMLYCVSIYSFVYLVI